VPLDETRIEFDEDKTDQIVNDVAITLTWMLAAQLKVNTNRTG
jgi:hypothetical protein